MADICYDLKLFEQSRLSQIKTKYFDSTNCISELLSHSILIIWVVGLPYSYTRINKLFPHALLFDLKNELLAIYMF